MKATARKKRGPETLKIGGRQYAVVPLAEYRRLCDSADDADDATIARQRLGEIKSGKIEPIPHEVIERLYGGGENPILVWREYRGLTQAQLATRVGIDRAYLSLIETGKREGRASTLRRLADALDCDLDLLVPSESR